MRFIINIVLLAGLIAAAFIILKKLIKNVIFSFAGIRIVDFSNLLLGKATIKINVQNKNPFSIRFCCINAQLAHNGSIFAQSAVIDNVTYVIKPNSAFLLNHEMVLTSGLLSINTIKSLVNGTFKSIDYSIRLKVYGIPLPAITGTQNL